MCFFLNQIFPCIIGPFTKLSLRRQSSGSLDPHPPFLNVKTVPQLCGFHIRWPKTRADAQNCYILWVLPQPSACLLQYFFLLYKGLWWVQSIPRALQERLCHLRHWEYCHQSPAIHFFFSASALGAAWLKITLVPRKATPSDWQRWKYKGLVIPSYHGVDWIGYFTLSLFG